MNRWSRWARALASHRELAIMVTAGLVILALIVWWSTPSPVPKPPRHPLTVIGFYENPAPGKPDSLASLQSHWRQITVVSPLWYAVTPQGTVINTGYDASLVTYAHRHHIRVVPLFINQGGRTAVLWTATTRHRAALAIRQVVRADHLDGVNLDFELLKPQSRSDLSRFVADVAASLHPVHKVVEVSVFPLVDVPPAINGAYDYPRLARAADALVLMAYDHHYSGGPPGPVAPYGWVRANVTQALRLVPRSRLVLGIGVYGYDWAHGSQPGPAVTLSDNQAVQLAHRYRATIHYNRRESQNWFQYRSSGGSQHIVWFMGNRSGRLRVQLAQQTGLAGIALWRLGMEEPGFWRAVALPRAHCS